MYVTGTRSSSLAAKLFFAPLTTPARGMYTMSMKLSQWMEWKGVSDASLASRVGVARASISRLRRGKMNPSMELARRLYAATDGAVQPNDLVDLKLSLKRRHETGRAPA